MISTERSETEWSIFTTDIRLRFTRLNDRWTHAIEVGPGPWKVVAESVEWEETSLAPPAYGPTFQELQFQEKKDEVIALALGQAGPHHFSASFRVYRREWECDHFADPRILQKRSESFIVVDMADRCKTAAAPPEARYLVGRREWMLYLGDSDDTQGPKVRGCLVWEVSLPDNYGVNLLGEQGSALPSSQLTITENSGGSTWDVSVAPSNPAHGGTNRLIYTWSHHRVQVFDKSTGRRDSDSVVWNALTNEQTI